MILNRHVFNSFFKWRKECLDWKIRVLEHLGILKHKYFIFRFKNGLKLKAKLGTEDSMIIGEILFDEVYTKNLNLNNFTCIDLGAHKGYFSCFISKIKKAKRVYAFEPEKENFEILKENLRLNSIKNVIPFNFAVAGKKGKRKLALIGTGRHSFYSNSSKFQLVNCITLEDIFNENKIERCDLLKIDVEGAENEILLNTQPKIFEKINYIIIEYESKNIISTLINKFNFYGFKAKINNKYLIFKKRFCRKFGS